MEPTAKPSVVGSSATFCADFGATIMSTAEIAKLEDAGRATMAYEPEAFEGDSSFGLILRTLTPAIGILAIAAALLFVIV